MAPSVKNIIICEDHQIVIDGLRSIFKEQDRYRVIDYAVTGSELFASIKKKLPDIILLDLNLPGKNGMEILKELKSSFPKIKVIILTMYNTESIIKEVIKHGGNGFLLKNCSTEDLFDALEHLDKSEHFYMGEGVKRVHKEAIFERDDKFYKQIKITKREREIIFELIQGSNVPQIAENLNISSFTVETHKKNIFRKLGIKSSIDLIKFANENHLFQ